VHEVVAMSTFAVPIVLPSGGGRAIIGPTGQPMIVKAGSAATVGAYALIEYSHAARAPGPPVHVHHQHEEAFYVLEGALTLLLDDEVVTVESGGFAVVPRGVRHSPSNAADVPVRFFFITSPPMEDFFIEMNELLTATGGRPTPDQLREIGGRHDSDFVDLPAAGQIEMHNEAEEPRQ
jgi:mannose-6-phosphate isomerase-like protein (cupin superfamily)